MKYRLTSIVSGLLALATWGCASRSPTANEPEQVVVELAAPTATTEQPSPPAPPAPPPLDGPLRAGILHSLSGTMAADETLLEEVALMAIDEINRDGGLLGQQIEPVVVDPASSWPLFAELGRKLLAEERAQVVFGGFTSVSRKSALPVFEELDGLLFYPAQYEGDEQSKNIFYGGALPNQSVSVVAEYLMSHDGGRRKRWFMIGTDYVVPRVQTRVVRDYLRASGIPEQDVVQVFTPFGHSDYQTIVKDLQLFAAQPGGVLLSFLHDDSAEALARELIAAKLGAGNLPAVWFNVDERLLSGPLGSLLTGQLLARSYFASIDSPENRAFKRLWANHVKARGLPSEQALWLNDAMEATYVGAQLWKRAVQAAGSVDTSWVAAALPRQTVRAPSGFSVGYAENHHLYKPYFMARVEPRGRTSVLWRSKAPEPPEAVNVAP